MMFYLNMLFWGILIFAVGLLILGLYSFWEAFVEVMDGKENA